MNYAAEQVDDRGFFVADYIPGVDEAGAAAGAPVMPAEPVELRKAQGARLKRGKRAYGILTEHITDPDHISHIHLNYFQEGQNTYTYLVEECQLAINAARLRELNKRWDNGLAYRCRCGRELLSEFLVMHACIWLQYICYVL